MTTMNDIPPRTPPERHWREVADTVSTPRPVELCRYGCGQPRHVPADACLTLAQKVGRMVGVVGIYTLAVLVLIMLVAVLADMT